VGTLEEEPVSGDQKRRGDTTNVRGKKKKKMDNDDGAVWGESCDVSVHDLENSMSNGGQNKERLSGIQKAGESENENSSAESKSKKCSLKSKESFAQRKITEMFKHTLLGPILSTRSQECITEASRNQSICLGLSQPIDGTERLCMFCVGDKSGRK
jgi:hypothetical protein